MASSFAPRLVNGPFGDPGLFVDLRWQGSAVLFDLGRNDGLPAAEMLRVSHVFVSHTHMDHFIGFDRMLRLFLNRDRAVHLYGPEGIAECVGGKLRGWITFNLLLPIVEKRDGASETAKRNAHLVNALRVIREHHRMPVSQEMLQAIAEDRTERIVGRSVSLKHKIV